MADTNVAIDVNPLVVGDQTKVADSLAEISPEEIAAMNWYYEMELKPGCFTGGFNKFTNMVPTHSLLERVDVSGLRTLDIGGMEGAFSVLLDRAGASVDVYDRVDMQDRIDLVQQAYGTQINYFGGDPFHIFVEDHINRGAEPYEFVLFSGVLYHVIEPMLFLHQIRALMRPGALMVLETSLIPDEECCLYFNHEGRFYKGSNYYQVSSAWLDYALRLLGFKVHNVEYIDNKEWKGDGRDVVRAAVLVELTSEPVVRTQDRWAQRKLVEVELEEFQVVPEYEPCSLADRIRPQGFNRLDITRREALHKGTQSLDITRLLQAKAPLKINDRTCVRHLEDQLKRS